MKIKAILQALHSSDDSKVIETLNTAIKLDPFSYWSRENRNVIHSGFKFDLHSGESVDLLIDIEPNIPALLWQESISSSPLPLILGLRLTLDGSHYKNISCNLATGCAVCYSELRVLELYYKSKLDLDHKEFKVFLKSFPEIFTAFPLSREYPKKLFYGAQGFTTEAEFHKEFESQEFEYYYQENQYYSHLYKEEGYFNYDNLIIDEGSCNLYR